jgi:hypothetical protein
MGMGEIRVSSPARRDRLWLINAFTIAWLTLLGAAGEELGYDRMLRTSTTQRRTHSLFRQATGCTHLFTKQNQRTAGQLQSTTGQWTCSSQRTHSIR